MDRGTKPENRGTKPEETRTAELLAPAGSVESLRAAVNAGADAVYIGGKKFGARAYAENPDEGNLLDAIAYAHLYGVHVHLTVNTLFKEAELPELPEYIRPYYEAGLDAAIVQDFGALSVLHRAFPLLPLHASTQTTVTGPESARFMERLGACRVIPARELSLAEIREIKQQTGLEVETFVHGSLCYSYSGQCLMSSLIGGRSGNRGRCAQPCRFQYELLDHGVPKNRRGEVCLLSCKDLCSLDLIPELLSAGIDSFKIEGRMKSARYTAGVVSIWRKYLDLYRDAGKSGYHVEEADRKKLLDLFDRGGQTNGYYFEHNGRDMIALRAKPKFRKGNPELNEEIEQKYIRTERKLPIRGEARFFSGQPMRLTVSALLPDGEVSASAKGPVPEKAEKSGALPDKTKERLLKTGGTPFLFENLNVQLEPGLFLPVSQVNALRRDALENLRREILDAGKRNRKPKDEKPGPGVPAPAPENAAGPEKTDWQNAAFGGIVTEKESADRTAAAPSESPFLHVSVRTYGQLSAAEKCAGVREISIEADAFPASEWKRTADRIHGGKRRALLCMPQIFRCDAARFFSASRESLFHAGFDAFVIRSLEEVGFLRRLYGSGRESLSEGTEQQEQESSRKPISGGSAGFLPPLYFDFNLYGMNREAERVLKGFGADRLTLPVELSARELKELGCAGKELVAAGRLPMMVSAQCLRKTVLGCTHESGILELRDRMGKKMPVLNQCVFCCNTILNSDPQSLVGIADEIRDLHPSSYRILLTVETEQEAFRVISACERAFLEGIVTEDPYDPCTRGSIRRGVE